MNKHCKQYESIIADKTSDEPIKTRTGKLCEITQISDDSVINTAALHEFQRYVRTNYDINQIKIYRKLNHSIRVAIISRELAHAMHWSDGDQSLAELIGLLHDIGRFEQVKRFDTFIDATSIDHGDLGVEILKNDNYIRQFIADDSNDDIIYTAIKYHNKFTIPNDVQGRALRFAKLIRDADKLDIFDIYRKEPIEYALGYAKEDIEQSRLSQDVLDDFFQFRQTKTRISRLPADILVKTAQWIFDINYQETYLWLACNNYISDIFQRFSFEHQSVIDDLAMVRSLAYGYVHARAEYKDHPIPNCVHRIAIDIDGVLTDMHSYELDKGRIYFRKEPVCADAYGIADMFGVSSDDKHRFWNDHPEYFSAAPVREGAADAIKTMHEAGIEIIMLSNRYLNSDASSADISDMHTTTWNWLVRNGILFDELIFAEDKSSYCAESGVDVIIEDKPRNIRDVSRETAVIAFDNVYNRGLNSGNISRAKTWDDVVKLILYR